MAKLVFAKILKNKNYTKKFAQIIDYFSHTIKKKTIEISSFFFISPTRLSLSYHLSQNASKMKTHSSD